MLKNKSKYKRCEKKKKHKKMQRILTDWEKMTKKLLKREKRN